MELRKVLIGTVTLEHDVIMENREFQYAASFEQLEVKAGEYPIYAYESDLNWRKDGTKELGWRNYIGYEGTIISSNVGGKKGDHGYYHTHIYDYQLAEYFTEGHMVPYGAATWRYFDLRPEWNIRVHDWWSDFDNKRKFSLDVVLEHPENITYL